MQVLGQSGGRADQSAAGEDFLVAANRESTGGRRAGVVRTGYRRGDPARRLLPKRRAAFRSPRDGRIDEQSMRRCDRARAPKRSPTGSGRLLRRPSDDQTPDRHREPAPRVGLERVAIATAGRQHFANASARGLMHRRGWTYVKAKRAEFLRSARLTFQRMRNDVDGTNRRHGDPLNGRRVDAELLTKMGRERYPNARSLLITADGGGSNGSRVRLWKIELQKLADELGVPITVCHLPPGTSKWNKIEHRLFSFITGNWRGKPLVSHQVIRRAGVVVCAQRHSRHSSTPRPFLSNGTTQRQPSAR